MFFLCLRQKSEQIGMEQKIKADKKTAELSHLFTIVQPDTSFLVFLVKLQKDKKSVTQGDQAVSKISSYTSYIY